MAWSYLGHAMWLLEVAGLRVLFDPLLDVAHHGGVFEVWPRRRVRAERLRADFVVVSHRHPDHFDVASLRQLAALDRDTVLLCSDELVAWAAKEVGFRAVRVIGAGHLVELQGARIFTTPSATDVAEWGIMVEAGGALAWNQVDSVLRGADDVRRVRAAAARLLGTSREQRPQLVMARWQPLLEVAAVLGEQTSFPLEAYRAILEACAATDARVIVPASAGVRHAASYAAMNRAAYPLAEGRFLRDVAARVPAAQAMPAILGARYRVSGDGVECEARGAVDLIEPVEGCAADDRIFRPFELPPVVDPNPASAGMREVVARWIEQALAPALADRYPEMGVARALLLVVEVVFSDGSDGYSLEVSGAGTRVSRALDPDYDALNVIAGSLLRDVIEGRRHWGDPLLAGMYRASLRAYEVGERGISAARLAPTFLYYALSYDESFRRALTWELRKPAP